MGPFGCGRHTAASPRTAALPSAMPLRDLIADVMNRQSLSRFDGGLLVGLELVGMSLHDAEEKCDLTRSYLLDPIHNRFDPVQLPKLGMYEQPQLAGKHWHAAFSANPSQPRVAVSNNARQQ